MRLTSRKLVVEPAPIYGHNANLELIMNSAEICRWGMWLWTTITLLQLHHVTPSFTWGMWLQVANHLKSAAVMPRECYWHALRWLSSHGHHDSLCPGAQIVSRCWLTKARLCDMEIVSCRKIRAKFALSGEMGPKSLLIQWTAPNEPVWWFKIIDLAAPSTYKSSDVFPGTFVLPLPCWLSELGHAQLAPEQRDKWMNEWMSEWVNEWMSECWLSKSRSQKFRDRRVVLEALRPERPPFFSETKQAASSGRWFHITSGGRIYRILTSANSISKNRGPLRVMLECEVDRD